MNHAPIGGPLGSAAFRLLWAAALVSNTALSMQSVGAATLMAVLAPSAMMVALVQTATSLPIFLFGLPGGVLADRVDRRRWLMITQAWMLVVSGCLCAVTLLDGLTPLLLLALTFALGAGNALNAAAWHATVADVVPRDVLPAALAMNSASYNLARIIGPAFAGLTIAALGAGAVFLINALCFATVVLALKRWRHTRQPSVLPPENMLAGMRSGLRYVRHARIVRLTLLRLTAVMVSGSAIWALLPLLTRDQLGLGATGYGLMLGALGAGAVVAALLLPRLRKHFALNTLISGAGLMFAAVSVGAALVRDPIVTWVLLLIGGAAWIAALSNFSAVIQTSIPGWVRARVGAIQLLSVHGSMALGSVAWGALASAFDVPSALLLSGAAVAIAVLATRQHPAQFGDQASFNPAPSGHGSATDIISGTDGPVAVEVQYRIEQGSRADFLQAAHALEDVRRRNGADQWRLYRALSEPDLYVERFIVASWLDYLRHGERATVADREAEERVLAFQIDGLPAVVHRFVAESAEHRETPHPEVAD